ncbi:hypothetical protein ACFUVV_03920 [Streptomyces sp. NPDC057376]|uniref:hypothetical protein n=1 Tax=unclassified Streptomyces TaxID=2593676 RepID=UPI00095FAA94|nr:hypothetical protein [Streptomyces sp. CB02414]OKI84144.1 hypothetical protein AMK11_22755 [Streptomyces sp. CB02414]
MRSPTGTEAAVIETEQAAAAAPAKRDAATTDEDKAAARHCARMPALYGAERPPRTPWPPRRRRYGARRGEDRHDDAHVAPARTIGLLQMWRHEAKEKPTDAGKALGGAIRDLDGAQHDGDAHNFQVHDVQFRVLEVNGEAPPAVLRGPRTRSSCRSAWTSATGGHQH